ncbi:hypothetical protein J7337_005956 [Fusarium musae]|uniref:Uncharacterized protein n=1 Tax=Fusarium musae TaxID=1042133 RepID=A0A9P8DJP0_9HYPO|nr:hypothetical protein J7337_005956 [Fusarium musae]KAG9503118.1 hypothetical protein J7337_005956 [Fusarium musae]
MGNPIDPEAVKQATMADLSRLRQEELPLSNETRRDRGPTYAPSRNNGTGHFSVSTKAGLENLWGAKINDAESQSMEGLELEDARPWAKGQRREKLPTIIVHEDAPAKSAPGRAPSARQSRGTPVQFKPTTPARWGPGPTETASQTNREEPSPLATHITEKQDECAQELVASEHFLYKSKCHLIPGKAEALSVVTHIAVKIIAESDGILEIRNDTKGLRIHNALELEQPVLDGLLCTIKVKTRPFSEKLRFATVSDAQDFKMNLIKLQNALLDHQKQNNDKSQIEESKAEDDGDLLMAASPIAETASDASIPVVNDSSHQVPTAVQEPLIMMDDTWGAPANSNIHSLGHETVQLSQLLNQVLEQVAALGNHSSQSIDGIEYEILEHALSHGPLHERGEQVREGLLDTIRTCLNMFGKPVSHDFASGLGDAKASEIPVNGNATDPGVATAEQEKNPKQVEDSTNHSVLGRPKGLGSSRFAKKPATFQGRFTGPIKY